MIDQFKSLKMRADYRRVFLDETGHFTPEARTVLADLYEFSRFFKNTPINEHFGLAAVEGSRAVVRHILKRIRMTEAEIRRLGEQGVYDDE